MEVVNQQVKCLNKYAERVPQIVDLAKKAGVEPGLILGGGLIVSALLILIFFGATILTVVITVVYPATKSIQALESSGDDDDKVWLTYWIMFGIFSLLDEFGGILLSFIPLYFYVRLAFFIFLMAPQTQGASLLYKTLVKPILSQHKDRIQAFIDEVKGSASDLSKDAKAAAMKELNDPNNLMKAMNATQQLNQKLNE